jgi:2-amino-4-hydroxy-6-hydroxymethyldihydropteridine diphosphokinase
MGRQASAGTGTSALHTVYLGLGSNLGDRAANLRAALAALAPDVLVTAISAVYETVPMHVEDQPDFLNLVCAARTALAPHELLRRLKGIERALGRVPGPRYGPRAIDLDLLLYDDLVLDTAELTVPHPRMLDRAFVLVPLAEIAPSLRHPLAGETIAALAASLDASGVRRIGPLFDGLA